MPEDTERRIADVRRFNRFYTRQIGVLREGLLESPFSLTEVRVLHELAHHDESTATHLAAELDLDAGYLSRVLRKFQDDGLVAARPSEDDGRRKLLSLTERGMNTYAPLNAASNREVEVMLDRLSEPGQRRLLDAMKDIEELLGATPEHRVSYILRPPQVGDMGWIVHRHGVVYNREYGWDERFEALVAEIVATFVREYDAKRDRCWLAEKDGEVVGSVFLVHHPEREGVARLRLLLVEPKARGLGIGRRLVQECTRFARQAGYDRITLWTNSVLDAARHIYVQEGYELVDESAHHSYGHDLVSQTWELAL